MFLCFWTFGGWFLCAKRWANSSNNFSIIFKFAIRHCFLNPRFVRVVSIILLWEFIVWINLLINVIFTIAAFIRSYNDVLFHWFYLLEQRVNFLRETFLHTRLVLLRVHISVRMKLLLIWWRTLHSWNCSAAFSFTLSPSNCSMTKNSLLWT